MPINQKKKKWLGKFTVILSLFICSFNLLANTPAIKEAKEYFQQGQIHYEAKNYITALPAYQKAVALAPMTSIYHHMLGKCYGRIAEEGNWFTALRYVRKTLSEFKKAVELDANNVQAWTDLEEFYRRAPGFLGGNKEKAQEIRTQLDTLINDTGTVNQHPDSLDMP